MSKKKVTIVFDGNSRKIESGYHELAKFVDQANAEPELSASIQSESLDEEETTHEIGFVNDHE